LLRGIFGHKKTGELTGIWMNFSNEELYNLCCIPFFIRMIKSRWMRWVGLVTSTGAMISSDHLSNLVINVSKL
jgi:hypothetical protein